MGSRAVPAARSAAARTEAMRVLRSNLLVAVEGAAHPVVVVTSARRGEGKTATCAAMAASLASAGSRVVLVDLDLRRPGLHDRLAQPNEVGAVDVLASRRPLEEALRFVAPPAGGRGFYFLAAGPVVANPTELLGTASASRLLDRLAASADVVLVDTPPVLLVADTMVVARRATGALLVVEAGRTPENEVRAAADALERNEVRVLGLALNKVDARDVVLGYGDDAGSTVAPLAGTAGADGGPWAETWPEPAGDDVGRVDARAEPAG